MKKLTLLAVASVFLFSCSNTGSSSSTSLSNTSMETYEQKVMTVEETEKANPTNFLTADGTYNENFWGDKFKVHGTVTNTATVATYKDMRIKVTFYSKTDTELGSVTYVLYERVKPGRTINFEWKLDKPNGSVKKLGWDVISAIAE